MGEKKSGRDIDTERSLCKLIKKDFQKEHFEQYKDMVREPEFVCKKCGRVAREANNLCKPEKL